MFYLYDRSHWDRNSDLETTRKDPYKEWEKLLSFVEIRECIKAGVLIKRGKFI